MIRIICYDADMPNIKSRLVAADYKDPAQHNVRTSQLDPWYSHYLPNFSAHYQPYASRKTVHKTRLRPMSLQGLRWRNVSFSGGCPNLHRRQKTLAQRICPPSAAMQIMQRTQATENRQVLRNFWGYRGLRSQRHHYSILVNHPWNLCNLTGSTISEVKLQLCANRSLVIILFFYLPVHKNLYCIILLIT